MFPSRVATTLADKYVLEGKILPDHRDDFVRDLDRAVSRFSRLLAYRIGRDAVETAAVRRMQSSPFGGSA